MNSGIYTESDIDGFMRSLITPNIREAISANVANSLGTKTSMPDRLDLTDMFTSQSYEKMIKSSFKLYFDTYVGWFSTFGSWVSAILGIIYFILIIKSIVNTFINGRLLYNIFGFSWRILFCWWENLVNIFIHQHVDKDIFKRRSTKSKNDKNYIRQGEGYSLVEINNTNGKDREYVPNAPTLGKLREINKPENDWNKII